MSCLIVFLDALRLALATLLQRPGYRFADSCLHIDQGRVTFETTSRNDRKMDDTELKGGC